MLPIELTNEVIRNSKAYKEYYACATGEAEPKPKASARRKSSSLDTSITPPTAITTPTTTGASDGDETREEESFDPIPRTLEDSKDDGNGEEDQGLKIIKEERIHEEEELDELYRYVDINQGRGLQLSQDVEDSHMTLTLVHLDGQQESSSASSQFVTSMLNPTSNAGIVHQYMNQQMNEAVRVAVQIQTDRLRDSYQRENDEFLQTIDDNMKRIIKEQVKGQVKEQVLKILPRIEQSVNAQLEAEVLNKSSHSSRTSYVVADDLSEMELKKILIEKMEGNKSIQRSNEQRNLYKALVEAYEADKIFLDTYGERVILKRRRNDDDDQGEAPSAGSDQGFKRQREGKEPESASAPLQTATRSAGRSTTGFKSRQASASESAFAEEPVQTSSQIEEPSHSVFETDTPLDFSNFIMNRLRVDTLTPELLAGPTYELMKGSCNSLIELEYHLEEFYKATMDQLDWVNSEGQQYPHNLLQSLSLIPDNRGRRRRVEDLQLRVESYQKRLNLMKPDTYRSDLKHREAYTAYSNPRGF
nr:hypothetical protein [Tanacetum cinerariifolium]